jgi:hypothetical protein
MQSFFCNGGFFTRIDGDNCYIQFKTADPETNASVPVAIAAMTRKDAIELAQLILKLDADVTARQPLVDLDAAVNRQTRRAALRRKR